MAQESFDKNSLGWQLNQLQKRLEEWWEWQNARLQEQMPALPEISWLNKEVIEIIAKVAFWIILSLLFFWILKQVVNIVIPYLHRLKYQIPQSMNHKWGERELSLTKWLNKAHKWQQQGNYHAAILALYMAVLQTLHDRAIALHLSSRTDGEYLSVIQQLPQPQPYQTLIMIHQQICFGGEVASFSLWERCHQAWLEIQTQIPSQEIETKS